MGLLGSFLGGRPETTTLAPISAQGEQQRAITGNISALPSIENLASQYNQFNVDQTNRMLGASDPYANQIATNLSRTRLDWSRGILGKDVADQVQNLTASRAVSGGFGGSGMQDATLARNFGLTSMGLQQQAQTSEQSWLQSANSIYGPGQFNTASMMFTPQNQVAFATDQQAKQFQADYVENQWKFYDSPGQRFSRFEDQVQESMGSLMGGIGGAMGGGGGGM